MRAVESTGSSLVLLSIDHHRRHIKIDLVHSAWNGLVDEQKKSVCVYLYCDRKSTMRGKIATQLGNYDIPLMLFQYVDVSIVAKYLDVYSVGERIRDVNQSI